MFGQIADRVGFELLPGGTTIDLATDQTFLQSVIARSRDSESLMSSSTLTGRVESYPYTTIAAESPTRRE
jgi:hypothetical protein